MKDIINYLQSIVEHESRQIGMTPKTCFNGTQEDHDDYHRKKAQEYEKAIKILSSKFMVRDWMCSEVHGFNDFDEANDFYKERIELCNGGETDVEIYAVIEQFNNLD